MNKKSPTCTVLFESEVERSENYSLFDTRLEVQRIKGNYVLHEVFWWPGDKSQRAADLGKVKGRLT